MMEKVKALDKKVNQHIKHNAEKIHEDLKQEEEKKMNNAR